MIDLLKMRCIQILEFIRSNGFSSFWREYAFVKRKAVIVMKDLHEAPDRSDYLSRLNIDLVEITPEILPLSKYHSDFKNRYFKALHYISKGYEGHAIIKGNTIIGDMWYFDPHKLNGGTYHRDLDWLGIRLPEGAVYSFDIFVIPGERGNNVSSTFQNNTMYLLRIKGYTRAYAYYWTDNVPAVWNTKVINKWKELEKLTVSRFFWYRRVTGKSELFTTEAQRARRKEQLR